MLSSSSLPWLAFLTHENDGRAEELTELMSDGIDEGGSGSTLKIGEKNQSEEKIKWQGKSKLPARKNICDEHVYRMAQLLF